MAAPTLPTTPSETRCIIYEHVLGDRLSVNVGWSAGRKAKSLKERVASHTRDVRVREALQGSLSLLKLNRQLSTEFSPIFCSRLHVFMVFEQAPDAYAALDRLGKHGPLPNPISLHVLTKSLFTLPSPSLRSQLKHLTFQFQIMAGMGAKADTDNLSKALGKLPSLETLTLSASDICRDTTIDLSKEDMSKFGTRWKPSTLRRLRVVQAAVPRLTKAFFKNCKWHSDCQWHIHAIRLTNESGVLQELEDEIDVDVEYQNYLDERGSYMPSIPGLRVQENPWAG